ncbi:MAG TPA: 3'-5' exonuclease, partial [Thermomicrobiales bacterium]|nr:3'-5' exonuclease [Thermomicrobiales bacterium]
MTDTYVALDLEATGMDPAHDEVIEIGAVKFRGNQIIGRFESLVRPSSPISLGIQTLTGLTNDALRAAPLFPSVAPKLRDFVKQTPIVGQSVEMDLDMLSAGGLRFSNTRFDTFELATVLLPELPAYNLATIASVLGVEVPASHRAVADAETTMVVFNRLVERAEMFDTQTLERLVEVTTRGDSHLTRFFATLLRERRDERQPTGTSIGAQLLARLSESAHVGPEAMFLIPRDRSERLEPTGSDTHVSLEALDRVMTSDGPFSKTIPGFEERPQQQQMLQAVAGTLNQGG